MYRKIQTILDAFLEDIGGILRLFELLFTVLKETYPQTETQSGKK